MSYSQTECEKLQTDPKISLKFEILGKLGQGCFGSLYKVINRITQRTVALKVQYHNDIEINTSSRRSNLVNEIMILEKLRDIQGVPKIYSAGKWSHGYFMEIQLLSSSLYEERNRDFTHADISSMACQLIEILSSIHKRGIIHQDLKPQNIMRNNLGALVIIDFGLSNLKKESDNVGDVKRKKRGFIGTPRYASIAAHHGQIQTPKDDIQSLLYVLGSLQAKKAPWFQLKGAQAKKMQRIQRSKQVNNRSWFKECGQSFISSFEYLQSLASSQIIDYSYLMNIFQFERKRNTTKSQKFKSLNIRRDFSSNNFRRKSQADYQLRMNVPTINIHFVDSLKRNEKNDIDAKYRVNSIDEENKQNITSQKGKTTTLKSSSSDLTSNNNFSQMAQDGYMELIQLLSKKIFSFQEIQDNINQDMENVGKEAQETFTDCQTLSNSKKRTQPIIQKLSKYEILHFKNPFET